MMQFWWMRVSCSCDKAEPLLFTEMRPWYRPGLQRRGIKHSSSRLPALSARTWWPQGSFPQLLSVLFEHANLPRIDLPSKEIQSTPANQKPGPSLSRAMLWVVFVYDPHMDTIFPEIPSDPERMLTKLCPHYVPLMSDSACAGLYPGLGFT